MLKTLSDLSGLASTRHKTKSRRVPAALFCCTGGAERDRTVDLLNAIQALSQLSYGPTGSAFLAEGDSIVNEHPRVRDTGADRRREFLTRGSVRMRRFGSAWGLVVSADFKSVGSAR